MGGTRHMVSIQGNIYTALLISCVDRIMTESWTVFFLQFPQKQAE
jgi:hypothetical protein